MAVFHKIVKLVKNGVWPWGQGFEAPIFQGDFEIVSQRIVGEKHLKCSLKLVGDNTVYEIGRIRKIQFLPNW
jgi:single-stranded-DNA-specific exonuclease